MSTAAYMPGPWEWHKASDQQHGAGEFNALESVTAGETVLTYHVICKDPSAKTAVAVSETNAALIAAAPDLLTACEVAFAVFDSTAMCQYTKEANQLRKAIAKAKGEQQ